MIDSVYAAKENALIKLVNSVPNFTNFHAPNFYTFTDVPFFY